MSQEPQTYTCATCDRTLPIMISRTNRNGNGGRQYVLCRTKRDDGKLCNFFRWASPKPSPAPSATSSPELGADTGNMLNAVSDALIAFTPTLVAPTPSTTAPTPSAIPSTSSPASTL